MNCILCELMSCDLLEVVTQIKPVVAGSSGPLFRETELNQIDIDAHFKLKPGSVTWQGKTDVKIFSETMPKYDDDVALDSLVRKATINPEEHKLPDDKIIAHLSVKGKEGATFAELKDTFGFDTKTMTDKLKKLEADKFIIRVGFFENVLILPEFAEPWSLHVGKRRIIPTPWLTLDAKITKTVYMKWCGMIMNKVFEYPGISISIIADDLLYASTRAIQDICMFLERFKCVELRVIKVFEPDLFSDDFIRPEVSEFNEYESPDSVLVFPVKNTLTKFACLRKKILNSGVEINVQ